MDSGQHSLDPSDQVQPALARIVQDFGVDALSDPELLTGLCADALVDLPREARRIVNASKNRIPALLSQRVKDFGAQTAVTMTATTLCEQESLDPAAATWVVAQLATAMGFGITQGQPLPPPPVNPQGTLDPTMTGGVIQPGGQPSPPQVGQPSPPLGGLPNPPQGGLPNPPQGGQPSPPYGGQPSPPYGYAPQAQGVGPKAPLNGFAVASLVLGIIGIFFGFILAIIFGIIALVQIRNSEGRQRGKGMATAGLILSGVWIVVLGIIIALHKPTPTPPTTTPPNSNSNNTNASGMPPVGNRSPLYDVADVSTTPPTGSNIWFYPAVRATAVVS